EPNITQNFGGGFKSGLRKRGGRNPVETAMQLKEKRSRTQEAKDIRRAQKEAGFSERGAAPSAPVKAGGGGRRHPPPEALLEKGEVVDFSSVSSSDRTPLTSPSPSPSPDFSAPGTPASHSATPSLLSEADLIPDAMPPQALFHGKPPTPRRHASGHAAASFLCFSVTASRRRGDGGGRRHRPRDGGRPSARRLGAQAISERKRSSARRDKSRGSPPVPRHALMGPYDERTLRRRLDACPLALAVTPQARRLRRKLLVRQAKRQQGLPLLDIDRALSLAGGVYGAREAAAGGGRPGAGRDLRVLDRFQAKASTRRGSPSPRLSFGCRLTGADGASEQSVKSPYTSRFLKTYIRRDYESRPPKMRLLAEIRAHAHRREPGWTPEADAPLDYCYVRPNHIPSVNAMCRHGFWPGVDLSECLQYPDFSVVALYKKVVVGFGFMVPDVKYNEAYVSFLLVHPEWRRAGIGTFMIYHLIQTCMGKDVTLHVSASNPAMLLYQKFGFQAEEYILDFYDKYYALDSAECRHAFFLRLRR
uniref:Lysine acetyltransferase 14 n=1 Tax=Hippocampus comes TaxID=109280 RepID=A0A3Q2XXX9_HIPCM